MKASKKKRKTSSEENANKRPSKRLYSVAEASEYLGRSIYSLRELIWDQKLPVVKSGVKMWIDVFDLDNFIENHKGHAT